MSIKDDFRSTFYSGVGLFLKGKEKIEEAAREFAKDNELAAEDGEKFVKDAVNKATEAKNDLEKFVEDKVDKIVGKMNLVKKTEYDELKKKCDELEAKIKSTQK